MSTSSTPTSFTPGSRSSSRTGISPSPAIAAAARPRPSKTPSRPRSSSSRPSSRARTKSWPSSWRPSPRKKKKWGTLRACWVPHDTRDQIVDFVRSWADKTEIPAARFLPWLGIGKSKFYDWKERFGKVNEHNAWVPRDHWLTADEKQRICTFARQRPLEGYRRLTFMMLDAEEPQHVACSPASTYRVLQRAGLLAGQAPKPT